MRRVIKANQVKNELIVPSDVISRIELIYFTTERLYEVMASQSDTDFDEEVDDIYYLSWSDEALNQLDNNEVHLFTNLELLSRIARIDSDKLSPVQLKTLKSFMQVKYLMNDVQKKNILKMLRECSDVDVNININRFKNRNFLHRRNMTKEDVKYVIQQLSVDDFDVKTRSINATYSGDLLAILKPKDLKLLDGTVLSQAKLYIKIDVTESKSSVAVISMHD